MKIIVIIAKFALTALGAFASCNVSALIDSGGAGCMVDEYGNCTTMTVTASGGGGGGGGGGTIYYWPSPPPPPDYVPVAGGGGNVPNVNRYLFLDGTIFDIADANTAGYAAVYYNVAVGATFALVANGQPTTYWTYRGVGYATRL